MTPWTCDVSGHKADPGLCRVKHAAAVVRARREKTQGIPAGYQPCLLCPEYLKFRDEEEKVTKSPYITGVCTGCGEERKIFAKTRVCNHCAKAGRKAPVVSQTTDPIPQTGPAAQPPETPAPDARPSLLTLTLDLSRVNGLTEVLLQEAHRDLRTPEAQALVILRTSLLEVQP